MFQDNETIHLIHKIISGYFQLFSMKYQKINDVFNAMGDISLVKHELWVG